MNKKEFIEQVAQEQNFAKKDVEQIVDAFLDAVTECLGKADKAVLSGFGTFEIRERKARKVMNPETEEHMIVPEQNTVGFKIGKNLKKAALKAVVKK